MSNVLFRFLLLGYLKTVFKTILFFYCFGIILNLFEEIEFLKNTNNTLFLPLTLTALYIPSQIIKLLPFIIFIASMKFLLDLRNSRDLLTLKVFGYSNFKIFLTLALTSFILGWLMLFAINPLTSAMVKYYEQKKSEYSRDIDHLVSINKNGLWIKENLDTGYRIISANETRNEVLKKITIFNLDLNYNLIEKIQSDEANISKNKWILKNVKINKFKDGAISENITENYSIVSKYDRTSSASDP